jgi:hypothetical protein
VYRRLVAGLAVLVIAGCDGGDEGAKPRPPSDKSGGRQVDEELAEDLGPKTTRPHTQLKYCDGRRVKVMQVSGEKAVETWRALREEATGSGQWPVLIGAPDDASLLADVVGFNCEDGHTFRGTLQKASNIDVARALSRVARDYGVSARDLRGSPPLPEYPYPKDRFLVPLDVGTGDPLPEVEIALLPINQGWQATAMLPWGNYNENPEPAVHTAVLRSWSRRYGAELVSMTGDVIEMAVTHPPTTDQEALALAREHFSYAPDIVQQGVGDVETLAAALKDGHAWYFWWD